jgi:hypothetical protein
MYKCLHVKYSVFLSDFKEDWFFSTDFREKTLKFNENPSGGAERTDGQPAMTKLIVVFSQLFDAPNSDTYM